jgi:hypothetical protein
MGETSGERGGDKKERANSFRDRALFPNFFICAGCFDFSIEIFL